MAARKTPRKPAPIDPERGERIRRAREAAGLRPVDVQHRLSEAVGERVTWATIDRYEKGMGLSERRIVELAKILRTTAEYLTTGVGTAVPTPEARAEVEAFLASPEGRDASDEDKVYLRSLDWGGIEVTQRLIAAAYTDRVMARERRRRQEPIVDPPPRRPGRVQIAR